MMELNAFEDSGEDSVPNFGVFCHGLLNLLGILKGVIRDFSNPPPSKIYTDLYVQVIYHPFPFPLCLSVLANTKRSLETWIYIFVVYLTRRGYRYPSI